MHVRVEPATGLPATNAQVAVVIHAAPKKVKVAAFVLSAALKYMNGTVMTILLPMANAVAVVKPREIVPELIVA